MITSFRNPLVKRIKRLRQKKYRQQEGAFFAEGLRVVFSAVEADAAIETIVFSSELLTSDAGRRLLRAQEGLDVTCVELGAPVFRSISERDNPVGLGAIVKATWVSMDDLEIRPGDIWLGLVEVSEPGNLGSILRTADAAGAAGLIIAGQTVDPFHPTAVKASMGTLFSVPLAQAENTTVLLEWAASRGVHTVASSARVGQSFWEVNYQLPALLLLGSEGSGLPEATLAAAEQTVSIPMMGTASSLNLSVAAGLLLYELKRSTASLAERP